MIERVRARDEGATAALIRRYELGVRLYAAKVAPRPDMAQDVAQKAFLLALKSIDRFDPAGDFGLWMRGIVRNVARQEWERLVARSKAERDGLAEYLDRLSSEPEPEGNERWLAALRDCVEQLPERGKEIVKLRYSLGMSCKDMSQKIGTSVDAVKMAMVRVRGDLRMCVKGKLAGV